MVHAFSKIKKRLLGARYDMSFAFIGPTEMQRLNRTYRHNNKPTDMLAFPLDRDRGEIVMCKSVIARKAPIFDLTKREYTRFLFIHACLHLTGHTHGRIMEQLEDRWCRTFRIPLPLRNGTTHSRRH